MIVIVFWLLIHSGPVTLYNVTHHGIPLACILVEFTFNRMTLEFNDWYVVIAYSLCYLSLIVTWNLTNSSQYKLYWFYSFALALVFLFVFDMTFFIFYFLQNPKTYSATRSSMTLLSLTNSAAETGKGAMTLVILQE